MFSIQYSKISGDITGTVNSAPDESTLPNGIGQLTFDVAPDWNGKKVDLETLTLIDAPIIEE